MIDGLASLFCQVKAGNTPGDLYTRVDNDKITYTNIKSYTSFDTDSPSYEVVSCAVLTI